MPPKRGGRTRPAAAAAEDGDEDLLEQPPKQSRPTLPPRARPILEGFPIFHASVPKSLDVASKGLHDPDAYLRTLVDEMLNRLGTDELSALIEFCKASSPLSLGTVCSGPPRLRRAAFKRICATVKKRHSGDPLDMFGILACFAWEHVILK
jgi:hypothetical protein